MGTKLELSPLINSLENEFQKRLVQEAMPRVSDQIAVAAQASMIRRLPDGIASGTRAKQTKAVRAKFRYHMNKQVRIKPLFDRTGVARLVGVETKAKQINFDMGKKAKTVGRVHILWGKGPAKVNPRIQRQEHTDIPAKVKAEIETYARQIAIAEILRAFGGIR